MPEGVIVYITAPDSREAQALGKALVERRLAACANVVPAIVSYYWWEGAVQEDAEALLLVKTTAEAAEKVIETVRALHSYSVPAVSVVPIVRGNPDYMRWMAQEVQPGG